MPTVKDFGVLSSKMNACIKALHTGICVEGMEERLYPLEVMNDSKETDAKELIYTHRL